MSRQGVFSEIRKIHRKTPVPESLFWNKVAACNFIKKETLTQVFSCEFCQISKNTYFYRTPPVAASKIKSNFKHSTYITAGRFERPRS